LLEGGAGANIAYYDASPAGVRVDLMSTTGTGGDAQGDVLHNIQRVVGSSFNDVLIGDASGNQLFGGAGDDAFDGGAAADYLDGGSGVNTAYYDTSSNAVQVNLAAHAGLSGDAQGDVLVNIQNVVGSSFGDNLTGDAGNNILIGKGGADAYAFGRGGGQDTIVNGLSGNSGATGALDFASGIATNQLWLLRSGNDLQIDVMGSTDHVIVSGWCASATADLAQLTTAGGLKLDSQLQQLVQSMAN
jgi:Ca2+-binding RTX toxin-like protein